MFVFEDLLLIDPMGLKEVLAKVDRKVLTVALKGTSEQLKNADSGMHVATRRRDAEGRHGALGPIKIKEVEAAQQQIIAVVRQLESEGVHQPQGHGRGAVCRLRCCRRTVPPAPFAGAWKQVPLSEAARARAGGKTAGSGRGNWRAWIAGPKRAREAHAAGAREGEAPAEEPRRRGTAAGARASGPLDPGDGGFARPLRREAEADMVQLALDRPPRHAARDGGGPGRIARAGDGRARKAAGAGDLAREGSSVARGAGGACLRKRGGRPVEVIADPRASRDR
jgi:hypothetical protein